MMDDQQLQIISEQLASILRTSLRPQAEYVLITIPSDMDPEKMCNVYSSLPPEAVVALFSDLAQDITGQTDDTTIN